MKTILALPEHPALSLESDQELSSLELEPGMTLAAIEKIVILETLRRHSQNRTHTAKALGIGIRTLQRKIKLYGSSPTEPSLDRTPAFRSMAVAEYY